MLTVSFDVHNNLLRGPSSILKVFFRGLVRSFSRKLVSGQSLHDAVAALGLTRFTVQEIGHGIEVWDV